LGLNFPAASLPIAEEPYSVLYYQSNISRDMKVLSVHKTAFMN